MTLTVSFDQLSVVFIVGRGHVEYYGLSIRANRVTEDIRIPRRRTNTDFEQEKAIIGDECDVEMLERHGNAAPPGTLMSVMAF